MYSWCKRICLYRFSPWYCGPALREACCRYFSRKGLRTSEQRWKAVRMYSSLQPRWQLSLRSTRVQWHAQDHRLRDQSREYCVLLSDMHVASVRPADLRFGAGVGSKLFEELAVSLIPHQGEVSYQLCGRQTQAQTHSNPDFLWSPYFAFSWKLWDNAIKHKQWE